MADDVRIQELLARTDIAQSDRQAFLSTLQQERDRTPDLPADAVVALGEINRRRLALVRAIAEEQLLECRKHYEEGQQLIASSDLNGLQIEESLKLITEACPERGEEFSRLFPEDNQPQTQARFLTLVIHRWGYRLPAGPRPDPLGQFWRRRIARYGGSAKLEGYLTATPKALVAALTLVLVDTGYNTTVARELFEDCVAESEQPGYKRVSGFKSRAQGRAMTCDLPEHAPDCRVTVIEALAWIREMTAGLRRTANGNASARSLFLYPANQGNISVLPEFQLTNGFKAMMRRRPELERIHFVPSMLRSSELLDLAVRDDGQLHAAQLKANQKQAGTTHGYTNHYPTRLIYEQKMRKFQGQYQAVVVIDIAAAAQKLGMPEAELQRQFLDACRSGLGTLCQDRTKAASAADPPACTKIESCCGCARMLVVADAENIADLLQWQEALVAARAEWETTRPERWEQTWLPWLVFTETVVEQIVRGPNAAVFAAAKRVVETRKQSGFQGPVPV